MFRSCQVEQVRSKGLLSTSERERHQSRWKISLTSHSTLFALLSNNRLPTSFQQGATSARPSVHFQSFRKASRKRRPASLAREWISLGIIQSPSSTPPLLTSTQSAISLSLSSPSFPPWSSPSSSSSSSYSSLSFSCFSTSLSSSESFLIEFSVCQFSCPHIYRIAVHRPREHASSWSSLGHTRKRKGFRGIHTVSLPQACPTLATDQGASPSSPHTYESSAQKRIAYSSTKAKSR